MATARRCNTIPAGGEAPRLRAPVPARAPSMQQQLASAARCRFNAGGSNLYLAGGGRLQAAVQAASRPAAAAASRRLPTRMCGIIGVFKHEGEANVEIYEGLLMLQHRGQDSAGMVTTNWQKFQEYKANGLVKDVFSKQAQLDALKGSAGIGHVRYPTAGSASAQEAQPFFVNSPLGIFMIHNGNLTNCDQLRQLLNSSTSFFNRHMRTDSDSEVLLNVLADEIHRAHQRCLLEDECDPNRKKMDMVFEAGEATMKLLKGAYSCISLIKGVGLVAFRDPHGIRPLVLGRRPGRRGEEWCVASEDCAFGPIGFERVRDVRPGEMIIIDENGNVHSRQVAESEALTPCIFEYIYLARPDSVLNDIPVYNFQLGLGTRLARRIQERGWDVDLVCPVPDGSRPAAIQISAELGLPYREGLVKNRYVGRTFIMPDQRMREMSVRRKLNAMPVVFAGKSVLLIDDSIVRGTTMSQIVDMVRNAGAKKVYLASASPPVRYPNVYGVDMPTRSEFVAHGLSEDEICKVLGADGLIYQAVEDLVECGRDLNPAIQEFDDSCFTGKYVTGDINEAYLRNLEEQGRGKRRARPGRKASLGPQPAIEPAVAAPNAPVAASPPPGCATLAAPLSAFGAAPPSAVDVDTAACCISLMEGMLLDCAVSLDRVALSGYDRGSELPPSESERALAVDSLVAAGLPVAKCCTAADAIAASPCLCDGATTTYVLTEWLEAEVGAVEPAFVQNAPSILLAACRIVAPSWASG
ncbi:Amidophosphoribosyltransferase [Micractinium conductrix]|uniref:amidophosphoribosyltransferase n=1 Tax=Micractinium conductrix TaxID=554055 RepID=A0A2P6VNS1_9CHLO|nr:Amidophosphoribosyltransferase [Micractinium conductrix]|eukprot:PSC75748.1 Amidophosphoribosyltransferase [Micractinium conductrix]